MIKVDIYWDLRATEPTRHTGVGKHVIEVIKGLRESGKIDLRILVAKDQVALMEQQAPFHGWSELPMVYLPHTNKESRFIYGAGFPVSLDYICDGRDLVYSPMELVLGLKHIPFVNTIHGIPFFEGNIPQSVYKSTPYRKERVKQAWFFHRCRRLCHSTFPVSDYLKDCLIQRFGFEPTHLHTVYNGAEELFFTANVSDTSTPNGAEPIRLLQIGGANLFDGAPAILQVARYLEKKYPDATISIVGDRHEEPWAQELKSQSNVRWCGFLSGARLLEEMKRATALLYVPLVESFGIIGVEAMAAGLPILATRSTALPEVLGDAVCWMNPEDETSIENGLQEVCFNQDQRLKLVESGKRQASRFTWPQVVDRVVAAFEKTVSDQRPCI